MSIHAFSKFGTLCRTSVKAHYATGSSADVTCPKCLVIMQASPANPLDAARELVTLALLEDDDSLDERVEDLARHGDRTLLRDLLTVLVEGLAATWESADDFSAHVLAVLCDEVGDA